MRESVRDDSVCLWCEGLDFVNNIFFFTEIERTYIYSGILFIIIHIKYTRLNSFSVYVDRKRY